MSGLSRTDKIVVRNIKLLPELFEIIDDRIDILDRSDTFFQRFTLDFLTVLVTAGQKVGFIALHTFIARHRISHNRAVSMSDM